MAKLYRQDGGWAWMVLFSTFLGHVIHVGMSFTFGVYFVVLRDVFGSSASLTSWVGSLNTGLLFGTGPLASVFLNKFGCRFTIILGGLIATTGMVASYFATNVYHLIITFGITAGLGFGLAYTPSVVMVGTYFNRWRYLATAIACTGGGLGNILFAVVFNKVIVAYGWQGSMLINGAIALNLVLCGVMMRPLDTKRSPTKMAVFDLTLLRDVKMFMFALSMICWNVGTITVYFIVSDYLKEMGVDHDSAIYLLTIIGIANTVGRPLAGVTALVPHWPYANLWLYTLSILGHGVASILFNVGHSYGVFAFCGILFGFFFGTQLGAIANVIIDLFGMAKFNNSYGYLMFAQGVGIIIGPPIAGAIVVISQWTQSPFCFT
ncbi:PREDICTED: monocarboxylate transporter 3-like [Priapulus caudatus]|uniref:Monocarboxylate transporter 3-like n=1 Tax=Priapulus caudatus TaxID=37621 RepID=A0ABM1FBF9_PRICU|nr:PREDICTED: monocarboxylate transporter 3-like [Priapulus caudatus]